MNTENLQTSLKKLTPKDITKERIETIGALSAMGWTEKKIAVDYLRMRSDDFSRLKQEMPELEFAIINAKSAIVVNTIQTLQYIMSHGTEKNKLQAAIYLHQAYYKKDDSSDVLSNIHISFANQTQKTKEEIEKEANILLAEEVEKTEIGTLSIEKEQQRDQFTEINSGDNE